MRHQVANMRMLRRPILPQHKSTKIKTRKPKVEYITAINEFLMETLIIEALLNVI